MTRRRILLFIPFFIAAATIDRCWIELFTSDSPVQWQHESALVCLALAIFFYIRSFQQALLSTGIFLALGVIRLYSMTVTIESSWFRVGSLTTPAFNGLSLGILFLYAILNFSALVHWHLDNKERKAAVKDALRKAAKEAGAPGKNETHLHNT